MDEPRHNKQLPAQQLAQPVNKMPAPVAEEFDEDLVFDSLPSFGTGSKTFHIVVRHSPFLLKRALVRAETREDAKRTFLEEVRRRHDARAAVQKMDKWGRLAAEKIRAALTEGLRASDANDVSWTFHDADAIRAERKFNRQRAERMSRMVMAF